jgi:hypothetical protein
MGEPEFAARQVVVFKVEFLAASNDPYEDPDEVGLSSSSFPAATRSLSSPAASSPPPPPSPPWSSPDVEGAG